MKLSSRFFAGMLASIALVGCGAAEAGVITFEDLNPGYDTYGQLPSNYAGFTWSDSASFVTNGLVPGTGFQFGTNGSVSMFDNDGGLISMSSATPFNFSSAYVTAAWNTNENVLVQGLRNGVLEYSTTINTSYNSPTDFNFNFRNVDSVVFTPLDGGTDAGLGAGAGNHIAIDDIGFSPVASVPEPSTYALMAIGLVAVLFRKSRKDLRVF